MRRRWGAVLTALVLAAAGCGGGGGDADELADGFVNDDGGELDEDGARCVGDGLVGLLELDDLERDLLAADLDEVGIDAERDGEDVAEVFERCDVDLADVDASDLRGLPGDLVGLALGAAYGHGFRRLVADDDDLDGVDRRGVACVADALVAAYDDDDLLDEVSLDDLEGADDLDDVASDADIDVGGFADDLAGCDVDIDALARTTVEVLLFDDDAVVDCVIGEVDDDTIARLGALALVPSADPFGGFGPESTDFESLVGAFESCVSFDDQFGGDFSAEDFQDALTTAFLEDPGHPLESVAATCTANEWVDALGVDVLEFELGLFPEDLEVADDLADLGFFGDEVGDLVDAAAECALPIQDLVLALLDTPLITPEQATCFTTAAPDAIALADFVEGLLGGDLDPFDEGTAAIVDSITFCGLG